MRILVTGSHGFIGRNLVEALEDQGHKVFKMDVKAGLNLFTSVPTVDVIYHLACINQEEALAKPLENLNVNAYGAKYLADAAKRMKAKLIYTSTASVYGPSERIPTPVSADINPVSDYAIAKLAGEYFVKNSGCQYEILRLSNVYGPGQTLDNPYCGVIGRFIEQALDGKPLTIRGSGTQTRDFTYVDDVIKVLTMPQSGNGFTRNVSTGVETSVLEIARYLSEILGDDLALEYLPKRSIDSIDRRRLITDFRCETNMIDGLFATVEWFRDSRREKRTGRTAPSRPRAIS